MFRDKRLIAGIAIVILIPIVAIGWWLLSPLFIDKTVEEEFPFAFNAVLPADMTRGEAEQIMSGLAKMSQQVNEAMPEMMAVESDDVMKKEESSDSDTMQASPVELKEGSFCDGDSRHKGSGTATIYRGADGSHLLRLENLDVTNGPDLRVILSPGQNPQGRDEVSAPGYIELGKLKGNMGNQNYEIPDGMEVSSFGSVVIYCKAFHVLFSVASLEDSG